MTNAPKFSLITVSYNSEKTILDSINSVLSQTYTDFELIIIDGSSSDKTLEIIKQFEDQRIKLISEPDKGIYDGMNKAFRFINRHLLAYAYASFVLSGMPSKKSFSYKILFSNFLG